MPDRLADPVVVHIDGVRPEVDRELALDAQEVTVAHRVVVGEVVGVEQGVDQLLALPRVARVDVLGHLLGRGDAPADVEVEAAADEEFGRLAAVRREDALVRRGRRQALHDGERRRAREERSA